MDDKDFDRIFGPPSQLDVQAYLAGDMQGRERVRYGADHAPVMEYLKSWHMPEEDYQRRREALDSKQYSYFGSCPECEAEGAIYPTPNTLDVMVCSTGCKVAWVVGSGNFSVRPEDHGLSEEAAAESWDRLNTEYREVEPLLGWKLDLLEGLDVGIRMLPAEDVAECVVCGFTAIPEDLRKLYRLIHVGRELPLLSLNRQAPLCMVCGGEFNHALQEAVNEMWGLDKPVGIGKMISTPHADPE
jgi:hypothetical protein